MGSVSDFPHVCDKIPTQSTSDRRAVLWLRVYPEGEGMASGVEVTVISVIRRQRMDRKRNGVTKCQALPSALLPLLRVHIIMVLQHFKTALH